MTLGDFRRLRPRDPVSLDGDGVPPLYGVVVSVSSSGVRVNWDDGTHSDLWLRHAEQGFDPRFLRLSLRAERGPTWGR